MVCVSEQVRQHALLNERLSADKLIHIPNGISGRTEIHSTRPQWSQLNIASAPHTLLFVGRLEKQKGILHLSEHYLSKMLADLPDWQFVLMGKGRLQPRIESSVELQGLTSRVHCVGWQSQPRRWIGISDVVLLPATYEGMPNVLLEAMAEARPFVAFAVDGVRQLLGEDYPPELASAQIAEPGQWTVFVRNTQRLANDAQLRSACGEANRQQVLKHFRLEDQLAKYRTLYQRLVHFAN